MKNKQTAANLILLLVAAIWGGGFIAGKMALTGLSPAAIIAYRYGMGALMCGIIFWKRVAKTSKDVMKKDIDRRPAGGGTSRTTDRAPVYFQRQSVISVQRLCCFRTLHKLGHDRKETEDQIFCCRRDGPCRHRIYIP